MWGYNMRVRGLMKAKSGSPTLNIGISVHAALRPPRRVAVEPASEGATVEAALAGFALACPDSRRDVRRKTSRAALMREDPAADATSASASRSARPREARWRMCMPFVLVAPQPPPWSGDVAQVLPGPRLATLPACAPSAGTPTESPPSVILRKLPFPPRLSKDAPSP